MAHGHTADVLDMHRAFVEKARIHGAVLLNDGLKLHKVEDIFLNIYTRAISINLTP